jgi:ADP-ribose pyrophosphatase
MTLEHDTAPPFALLASETVGRLGAYVLRRDRVALPGGQEVDHMAVELPSAAFIVPLHDDGSTVIVRQWRQPWGETSWEVPAGTMEEGESPLECARRELAEEAGLEARRWTDLGFVRGSALLTNRQHLFLAEDLRVMERRPEVYEADMIVRRLPLRDALAQAMTGGIFHAASVAALARAAARLGLPLFPA